MNKKYICQSSQRGVILVTVLLFISVTMLLVFTTSQHVRQTNQSVRQNFSANDQVINVINSGVNETIDWFNKQPQQPVRYDSSDSEQDCADQAFNPKENADLRLSDTDDDSIGIVRDIKIYQSTNGTSLPLYGRYIVKRQGDCSDLDDAAVRDVTVQRLRHNEATPGIVDTDSLGIVWSITSEGILYYRKDPSKAPDESPNRILQSRKMRAEIARISMTPPKSAITVNGASDSRFNNNCNVLGDRDASFGILRDSNAGSIIGTAFFTLPTTGSNTASLGSTITSKGIFSLNLDELKGFVDNVYLNINDIPNKIDMGFTYLQGNFTFTEGRPLLGKGALIVDGNLTLGTKASSQFDGLIYVTGKTTIEVDNYITGALVTGSIDCRPSNKAFIEYNGFVIKEVNSRLSGYKRNFQMSDILE